MSLPEAISRRCERPRARHSPSDCEQHMDTQIGAGIKFLVLESLTSDFILLLTLLWFSDLPT